MKKTSQKILDGPYGLINIINFFNLSINAFANYCIKRPWVLLFKHRSTIPFTNTDWPKTFSKTMTWGIAKTLLTLAKARLEQP